MGFSDCKPEVGSSETYWCVFNKKRTLHGVEIYRAHVFLKLNPRDKLVNVRDSVILIAASKLKYEEIIFSSDGKKCSNNSRVGDGLVLTSKALHGLDTKMYP